MARRCNFNQSQIRASFFILKLRQQVCLINFCHMESPLMLSGGDKQCERRDWQLANKRLKKSVLGYLQKYKKNHFCVFHCPQSV